jgi:hypothetical protein
VRAALYAGITTTIFWPFNTVLFYSRFNWIGSKSIGLPAQRSDAQVSLGIGGWVPGLLEVFHSWLLPTASALWLRLCAFILLVQRPTHYLPPPSPSFTTGIGNRRKGVQIEAFFALIREISLAK